MANGKTSKENRELLLRVQEKVKGKTITCAQAFAIAEDLRISKVKMGKMLNELQVKITKCQLGCF